jgi:hypothetical protein
MIDAIGSPIEAGSTVLTGHYWSNTMNHVTKVVEVRKKYVYLMLDTITYDWKNRTRVTAKKLIRRQAHQVIVIDKQLKFNRKKYPENFL